MKDCRSTGVRFVCFKSISDLDKIVSERQEATKDEENIKKEQDDLEKLSFSDLKMFGGC